MDKDDSTERPVSEATEAQMLRAAYEACKLQAQIWKQEARTANATIAEIYQLCTGKTGEPGNWHGAEPVRKALGAASPFAHVAPEPNETVDARWHAANVRQLEAALAVQSGQPAPQAEPNRDKWIASVLDGYEEHYDFPAQGRSHMRDCLHSAYETIAQAPAQPAAAEQLAEQVRNWLDGWQSALSSAAYKELTRILDGAAQPAADALTDAARYRWLREHFAGVDFMYGEPPDEVSVITFLWPPVPISADLDASIDHARGAAPKAHQNESPTTTERKP